MPHLSVLFSTDCKYPDSREYQGPTCNWSTDCAEEEDEISHLLHTMADLISSAASSSSGNNYAYRVFINYRSDPKPVKESLVNDLYQRLREHKLRPFLDGKELMQQGKNRNSQIKDAIRTASVQIPVFCGCYAKSRSCLTELSLMVETGATIIPVYYGVKSSDLLSTDGLWRYGEELHWKKNHEPDTNSELIAKWREALSEVLKKPGFELEDNGDAGQLDAQLDAIVEEVENTGHVFINGCPDVRKEFASHLHHRLLFYGQKVFLDFEELRNRDRLTPQMQKAIKNASFHIVILSNNYSESSSCLNDLIRMFDSVDSEASMFESEAITIPVFHGVKPAVIRQTKTDNLSKVADISGFELAECNDDQGLLVNKIVQRVLSSGKTPSVSYDVFINHRGPDCKNTLASHLYHGLVAKGLRPFLDREDLEKGQTVRPQLQRAIKLASVNIAIFSPKYVDSGWCMEELELMLKSQATIIPVYYGVEPSDLKETTKDSEGIYARALSRLELKRSFDLETETERPRSNSNTIEKWRWVLSEVVKKEGFNLKSYNGDEGELLDKIVTRADRLVSNNKTAVQKSSCRRGSSSQGTALLR